MEPDSANSPPACAEMQHLRGSQTQSRSVRLQHRALSMQFAFVFTRSVTLLTGWLLTLIFSLRESLKPIRLLISGILDYMSGRNLLLACTLQNVWPSRKAGILESV